MDKYSAEAADILVNEALVMWCIFLNVNSDNLINFIAPFFLFLEVMPDNLTFLTALVTSDNFVTCVSCFLNATSNNFVSPPPPLLLGCEF